MASNKMLLVGGGGHCHSVMDSLLQIFPSVELGIIGRPNEKGKIILGVPVVGCDEDLVRLYRDGWDQAVIAIGSIGDSTNRKRLFHTIKEIGFFMPPIIDPTVVIAANCKVAAGIFAGKGAVINAGAEVGEGAIINTGSIVEHDCKVGAFSHVSPGAVLCGNVSIEEGAHVGAGSVVIQGVSIGRDSMIGAGSVVIRDIPPEVIAYGNPCSVVRNKV